MIFAAIFARGTPMAFDTAGSDSGKIDGLQTVRFGYDQSSLTTEAKKQLSGNATWMKSHDKVNVQIEGHCDSRGSLEYNLALGERRAQSVKTYLVGLGIPTAQMTIISYGKEKPVATGDNEEAWSKNRRANFVPLAK
jgi:peptidoglycan-associated lipoprotein